MKAYEQNVGALKREVEEYKKRLGEYENAMRKMEGEIDRLNNIIKVKVQEIGQYEQRYKTLTT